MIPFLEVMKQGHMELNIPPCSHSFMHGITASCTRHLATAKGDPLGSPPSVTPNKRFGSFYTIVTESIAKALILEGLGLWFVFFFLLLLLIMKYSVTLSGGTEHLSSSELVTHTVFITCRVNLDCACHLYQQNTFAPR